MNRLVILIVNWLKASSAGVRLASILLMGSSALTAALGIAWADQDWIGPDILPEIQISSNAIVDYEFDWGRDGVYCPSCNFGQGNNRLTFVDFANRMWVGWVDYATGDFQPRNGKGCLVDTGVPFVTDFGNGPEWIFSTGPSQICYTKYVDGAPQNIFNAGIAVASQQSDWTWSGHILITGMVRQSPLGTLDIDDWRPRINYQDRNRHLLFWRSVNNHNSEEILPFSDDTSSSSRRWVPGTRKIIFSGKAAEDNSGQRLNQMFLYDTDSSQQEQLTFDPVPKWDGMMWRAPEFNNEYVFFAVYGLPELRNALTIYRKLRDSEGVPCWTEIKRVMMPESLPNVWTPEVFVHNGRSYVFFQLSTIANPYDFTVPTQLAITGIDPAKQDFRMLTNDFSIKRIRMDPEYFITANGPYIYYNRFIPEISNNRLIDNGVWRVDTKLGPPNAIAKIDHL